MLNFLGSQPEGTTEWECSQCKSYFDFLARDDNAEPLPEIEPKFCPICGGKEPK